MLSANGQLAVGTWVTATFQTAKQLHKFVERSQSKSMCKIAVQLTSSKDPVFLAPPHRDTHYLVRVSLEFLNACTASFAVPKSQQAFFKGATLPLSMARSSSDMEPWMQALRARKCASCAGKATSWCKSCEAVMYCGRACQLEDWPKHKAACKAAKAQKVFAEPGVVSMCSVASS